MVEYNKNPAQNWRAKDIAMYVIIALAVQGQTMRRGCTRVNENLFPKDANGKHPGLWSFFEQHVLPELNKPIAGGNAILKTDCMHFTCIFRHQIPEQKLGDVMNSVVKYLDNTEYVVHSFAAYTVSTLLSMRRENTNQ